MTDTNNNEQKETFESFINKVKLSVYDKEMIKHFHDKDIKKINDVMTFCCREKDKQIAELQDFINKLPEILISRFGFDDQIENAKKFTIKIFNEEIKKGSV